MSLIASIRGLTSYLKSDETTTDNFIFKLHYRHTVVLLLIFSISITAKQHFGDPIDCIGDKSIKEGLLDTYCWIATTYSNPEDWKKEVGTEVAYPGVSNGQSSNGSKPRVYHAYYQWVWFVLYVQTLLFYIPRTLWISMEGDRIKNLMSDLHKSLVKPAEREKKCEILSRHLFDNRKNQGNLIYWHLMAEMLNLINVLFQMQLMHQFLGNKFWSLGIKLMFEEPNDDPTGFDSLMEVFPRMTKCTFHTFGSSGDVQKYDAFCLLSINNLNEKIYLILWFWFVILAVITFFSIIYRILTIIFPDVRIIVTQSRCPLIKRDEIEILISEIGIDDWFILDRIGKNAEGFNYKSLCEHYHSLIKDEKPKIGQPKTANIPSEKLEYVYVPEYIKDTQC